MTGTLALEVGTDLVNPLISGVIQGSVYGLIGLGLVLLYKGNRIFNFAQGEFGSSAVFLAFALVNGSGFLPELPYGVAIVVGLLFGIVLGLLTERFVARPLFRQPKVTLVVASAGVALLLIAFQIYAYGLNPQGFDPIARGSAFSVGTLQITKQQVVIVGVLALCAVLSALFFSRTRTGVAVLAVSQEPTATSLVGISVNRISALTWGLAGLLGAAAGLLSAGSTNVFGPGFMTRGLLIPGFTAAVFGGITSLPGAFVGGVLIGVVEQYAVAIEGFPGANRVVVFAVLLATLLIKPAGLLGKEA